MSENIECALQDVCFGIYVVIENTAGFSLAPKDQRAFIVLVFVKLSKCCGHIYRLIFLKLLEIPQTTTQCAAFNRFTNTQQGSVRIKMLITLFRFLYNFTHLQRTAFSAKNTQKKPKKIYIYLKKNKR